MAPNNNITTAETGAAATASTAACLTLDDLYTAILDAHATIKDIMHHTRQIYSETFSRMTSAQVYLKHENMQKTGSFKARGALNAITKLSDEQKRRGVIAASSGNHAQAVAFAATRLGLKSTIYMPKNTPVAKIHATLGYGADVVLHGDVFDKALEKAKEVSTQNGSAFIHPFNDVNVIAGQGTIGLEIVQDCPEVDIVLVPIGGGGLSTGIATAVKKHRPQARVYAVESSGCPSMAESLKAHAITGPNTVSTICDGIAVKRPGDITLALAEKVLDGVLLVDDFEVSKALFMLLERKKVVCEPSGAIALAALLATAAGNKIIPEDITGKKICVVLSGGNINMGLLSRIINQQLFVLGRRAHVKGIILDTVGNLNEVLTRIASAGLKVLSVRLDRSSNNQQLSPLHAELNLELEVPDQQALSNFLKELEKHNLFFKHVL